MPSNQNSKRCPVRKKSRSVLRKDHEVGVLSAPSVKVFKGVKKEWLRLAMAQIMIAPAEEAKIKEWDADAIFTYYDRNRAIHMLHQMSKGLQSGTCGVDSKERFKSCSGTRKQIRVQLTLPTGPELFKGHPKKDINHWAIIYKTEHKDKRKWRYETYSNGKHMDILLVEKFLYQPYKKITYCENELEPEELVELMNVLNYSVYYGRERLGYTKYEHTPICRDKFIKKWGHISVNAEEFCKKDGKGVTGLIDTSIELLPYFKKLYELNDKFVYSEEMFGPGPL